MLKILNAYRVLGALTKNMQIRSNGVGAESRDLLLDFGTLYLRNG